MRQLFERLVRSTATTQILENEIVVRLNRRAHNPLLIAAEFREDRPAIPWLGDMPVRLLIGLDEPKLSHPDT